MDIFSFAFLVFLARKITLWKCCYISMKIKQEDKQVIEQKSSKINFKFIFLVNIPFTVYCVFFVKDKK